jgi:hypothetical protein
MPSLGLEAEEQTLRAFVVGERRQRLISVLRTKKRASEVGYALSHRPMWDPRFVIPIAPGEQHAEAIEQLLRASGAPLACRVLGGRLDGEEFELDAALRDIVGFSAGCLVICIPGRLAYHEGEERNDRVILRRTATA